MKLAGDYVFEAPVDEVWSALMDPVVLAAVMPGCEKLDLIDGQYVGELNIKVGPVQGKFSGKVELKDIVEPKSYVMIIDGRGVPGFVKATAKVSLEPEGTGTKITYDADAQVGGKIASVGQRLLEASSRAITKQSLDGLNENVKLRYAASKAHAGSEAAEAKAAASTKVETPKADAEPAKPPAADAKPADEPATAEKPTDETATAPEEAPVAAATSEPPPPPKKKAPPPVVLKKVDQNALAASIAKEVSKSLLPKPVLLVIGVLVVALVAYLALRH